MVDKMVKQFLINLVIGILFAIPPVGAILLAKSNPVIFDLIGRKIKFVLL
jgi:hypothetical protein